MKGLTSTDEAVLIRAHQGRLSPIERKELVREGNLEIGKLIQLWRVPSG